MFFFFFFQAEDGIRDDLVTGVQTCALPILGETFCRWRIDGALRLAQRQIRSLVAGHSALSRLHVSRSRCREGESRHESDNGNGQDRHLRFEQSCDIELRVIERKAPWEPRSFTELIVNAVRALHGESSTGLASISRATQLSLVTP